jgi:hypothetical protein
MKTRRPLPLCNHMTFNAPVGGDTAGATCDLCHNTVAQIAADYRTVRDVLDRIAESTTDSADILRDIAGGLL